MGGYGQVVFKRVVEAVEAAQENGLVDSLATDFGEIECGESQEESRGPRHCNQHDCGLSLNLQGLKVNDDGKRVLRALEHAQLGPWSARAGQRYSTSMIGLQIKQRKCN